MRLISFTHNGGPVRGGVLEGDRVRSFVAGDAADPVLALIAQGGTPSLEQGSLRLDEIRLEAPMLRPPRIFGIGLNYREHAVESKMQVQKVPTVFLKLSSSVVGPEADVVLPRTVTQPDFEVELAVVIGRPGYRIPADDWESFVFGYTVANDVSARDVQLATTQWTLGKSFPTFAPLGPAIVTRDEVPDPHGLDIKLTLDGELMQSANTRDLIFPIPRLIEYISSIAPLQAGDVILTGTPPGVGLGRTPQRWLQPDEEMVLEIESLGVLRNWTRREEDAAWNVSPTQ